MKKLSSITIQSLSVIYVFAVTFGALALMYVALQSDSPMLLMFLVDFVYLPIAFYVLYRLTKLAEDRSYQEFCDEHYS